MMHRTKAKLFAGVLLAAMFMVSGAFARDKAKAKTFQGTISDTWCGMKHGMMKNATDKQCAIGCVKQMGSKYALVAGNEVYTLEGKEGDLEKLAGEKAKVTGTPTGTTIKVTTALVRRAKAPICGCNNGNREDIEPIILRTAMLLRHGLSDATVARGKHV